MAGAFRDYIRDVEAEIADVLKDNPTLTREDLEVGATGGIFIKEEAVKRLEAERADQRPVSPANEVEGEASQPKVKAKRSRGKK